MSLIGGNNVKSISGFAYRRNFYCFLMLVLLFFAFAVISTVSCLAFMFLVEALGEHEFKSCFLYTI